jgi:small subunit ribosomal protein S7
MNAIMFDGKKSDRRAHRLRCFRRDRRQDPQDPIEVFHQAARQRDAAVEVRSRRVGGATYQVPVEVRTERRQALAIRWLITAARKRNENTMVDRLSGELLDAANNRGTAVSRSAKTRTGWRTPTARSRTIAGNFRLREG